MIIIGIDPDIEKNGVAICENGKLTQLLNLTFVEVIELVMEHQDNIKKVVIEAGWLIPKSNWHTKGRRITAEAREKIAKNVGENHATGKHLTAFVESLGVKVQLLTPQGKIKTIKGLNGNPDIKSSEIFNKKTGWTGSSNPETRDAGMLVYGMQ